MSSSRAPKTSFYTESELAALGFKHYGRQVKISRHASLYSPEEMAFGDFVRIDDFCILSGKITVGNFVHIGAYCGLFAHEKITLESYTGLSSRVSIYTVSEDYLGNGLTNPTVPAKYRHPKIAPVHLNAHVIIGAGSVILPGVTIGEGKAVGALSLVLGSLKPWKVAGGIPSKPYTDRRKDRIKSYQEQLEAELTTTV